MITQARLKELMHYDPETGVFVRKVTLGRNHLAQAGAGVGTFNKKGYLVTQIAGKGYKVHRLAFLYMMGAFPLTQVDHINGSRADNRWVNLRAVTNQENARNRKRPHDSTSGVMGVHWHKSKQRWQAHIKADGKFRHLGYTVSKDEAVALRKQAELTYGYHPNHGR